MIPKFRAWDKYNKKMLNVKSIHFMDNVEFFGPYTIVVKPMEFISSEFIELMQSTGLKNCKTPNGENCEGWEGDIAQVGWSDEVGEFHSHKIVLKNPFEYTADEIRWLINCHYIEILGNVYQHPELLEEKQ